jgi:hypothetical protein
MHGIGHNALECRQSASFGDGATKLVEAQWHVSKQLELIDGLRRATVLKLKRAIGAEHQHWETRLSGFNQRRQVVRSSAA